MMGPEQEGEELSQEEMDDFQQHRALNDAELIKGGAKYEKGRLIVASDQVNEAKNEMELAQEYKPILNGQEMELLILTIKVTEDEIRKKGMLDYDPTPIENLKLTPQIMSCLKDKNLNTVGDVALTSKEELIQLRNIGPMAAWDIENKLNELRRMRKEKDPRLIALQRLREKLDALKHD